MTNEEITEEIEEGENEENIDSEEGEEKETAGEEEEEEKVPTCPPCAGSRIEIARDADGVLFWMLYAKNGKPIATSPVGYKKLSDLKDAVTSARDNISTAQLVRLY